MNTDRNTTNLRTGTTAEECGRRVRSDAESQAIAREFLTELIGAAPDDLEWDDTHHLQGHGHLDGHELVVVAPRDDQHRTIVLIAEDWDAVRRASAPTSGAGCSRRARSPTTTGWSLSCAITGCRAAR
jgi:hypothetical protein